MNVTSAFSFLKNFRQLKYPFISLLRALIVEKNLTNNVVHLGKD